MILDSSSSLINCAAASSRILLKLYRIMHKNLIYHIKWILWSENKIIYFLFASEISAFCSKSREKVKKYLMR